MNTHHPHEPLDDELVSAYLDNELSPEDRAKVDRRLANDPAARKLLEELQAVSQAVRAMPPETLGEDLRESILRRAERAKLEISATTPSAVRPADDSNGPHRWTIGRSRRGWMWAGMAIAAALMVMILRPDEPRQDAGPELIAARSERPESEPRAGFEFHATEPATAPVGAAQPRDEMSSSRSRELLGENISSPGEQAPLLVVRVSARPDAIRNRTIDAVFLRNGIELEIEPGSEESDVVAKEPEMEDLARAGEAARAYRVPQQRSSAVDGRLDTKLYAKARRFGADVAELKSGTEAEDSSGATAADKANLNDIDMVLVEAPLSQVLGCIDVLQADTHNYQAIEVDASDDPVANANRDSLNRYWGNNNRGGKEERSPDKDSFGLSSADSSVNEPSTAGTQIGPTSQGGGVGGAALGRSIGKKSELPRSGSGESQTLSRSAQFANAKEVANEALQQSLPLATAQRLKLANNGVQVLFVLSADPVSSPEPVAEPNADE